MKTTKTDLAARTPNRARHAATLATALATTLAASLYANPLAAQPAKADEHAVLWFVVHAAHRTTRANNPQSEHAHLSNAMSAGRYPAGLPARCGTRGC